MASIHGAVHLVKWGWKLSTHPHTALFALRHAAHPHQVAEAAFAFDAAKQKERQLWGTSDHADDGIDALRHTYAAALLSYRLVHKHGLSPSAAARFTIEAGRAYEADGDDAGETHASARMDEHNNAVGARLGARLAHTRAGMSLDAVFDTVRGALQMGRLEVVDHRGRRRTARPADLPSA
jgi:hypothetical protein